MRCVCRTACQVRMPEGHIQTFAEGQVHDFFGLKEAPLHFDSLESGEINFAWASKEELMGAKWSYKTISNFTKETFDLEMPKGSKAEMVNRLLDMRLRHVDMT